MGCDIVHDMILAEGMRAFGKHHDQLVEIDGYVGIGFADFNSPGRLSVLAITMSVKS